LKVIVLFLPILLTAIFPTQPAFADGPHPGSAGDEAPALQTPCPADTACGGAPLLQVDPIWWNENKLNQINPDTYALASQILSNPYNTCGPAALTMVMNFLTHVDNPASTSQYSIVDVLNVAQQMGYYKPPQNDGALGASDLRDIASKFGFKQVYPRDGGSFLTYTDFINQLAKGYPAIAGMRFAYDQNTGEYLPTTDPIPWNHFAVIFGFTDDGKFLWMLNPHPGIGLKADADVHLQLIQPAEFRAAWTKADGSEVSDYGQAIFLR
jgi:hypothetical protein